MYRPTQFREDRADVLVAAVKELKFASLVTLAGTELIATHIPMLIKEDAQGLRLECHVARANPQWKQIHSAVNALAIFVGPQAYISPTWYATKAEHQRVVPTWNYISVQASGPLSVIENKEWLLRHIGELTDHNEEGQTNPWRVDDAPGEFIDQLCGAIVGLSIDVQKFEGAWKMAQHRSEADRLGVIQGLNESGENGKLVACEMARLEAKRSQD